MSRRLLMLALSGCSVLLLAAHTGAEVFLPGMQPQEAGIEFAKVQQCQMCHAGTKNREADPFLSWQSSMMSMSRESTFVPWTDIEKAVMDDRKKVISLSSGRRMLVRLFCTPETYDQSVEMVERILFEAELKHI